MAWNEKHTLGPMKRQGLHWHVRYKDDILTAVGSSMLARELLANLKRRTLYFTLEVDSPKSVKFKASKR